MVQRFDGWLPDSRLLDGQLALIVGGAGGIGEATTRLLAAAGARVAIAGKNAEAAQALAGDIASAGGQAHALIADVREEQACASVVSRAVEALGAIDIVVNVVGGMFKYAPWRPLREWTTESWDEIVNLNLRYVFWLSRAAIPALEVRGGGSIVNITSINGAFGCPNQSAYGAAKAGLINLTKTMALECGASGIRVNAVSPGVTLTADAADALPEETTAKLSGMTALQRLGRPDDIARAVLFFACPMAEHVTGQMLLVDGGISVNFPYFTPGTDHF